MTVSTPWGPADRLRERRLPPGPTTSRAAAADNQGERLMGATIAVVAERGYQAARVADVIELAGVSRASFYKKFANKHECFMATLDHLLSPARDILAEGRERSAKAAAERLADALDAVLRLAAEQPAAAWLCLVETHAAGPRAAGLTARVGDECVDFVGDALREDIGDDDLPATAVLRAVLGGIRQVIVARIGQGRAAELPGLAPDLLDWARCYRAPPRTLRRPRKLPPLPEVDPDPNRQRARMLAAVTELVAEQGFQHLTITEIAQRAGVSLSTFYENFDGKPEALVATLDDRERRLRELSRPARAAAADWPHAVDATLRGVLAFMATEPVAARIGGIAAYAGGPSALARVEQSMERFAGLLRPGYDEHPGANPLAAEAACGAIATLFHERIAGGRPAHVYAAAPIASYLALAPFVGRERACAIANGD